MAALVHDNAGPIILLDCQNHWLIDIDVPGFADTKPYRAFRLADNDPSERYAQISGSNLKDNRLSHP